LNRCYGEYRARYVWKDFENSAIIGNNVRLGDNARLINRNSKDSIRIGKNSVIRGIIRIEKNGSIEIGNNVYIGDNTIISAADHIRIEDHTLVAHGAQIFDNTTHPIDWQQRRDHFDMLIGLVSKNQIRLKVPAGPIIIGKNALICMNAIVLRGVKIGSRSIVGSGCIVTQDIDSDTVTTCSNIIQSKLNKS
jgi:acetyltransferase-like isoleucine patch superfamily enzyme